MLNSIVQTQLKKIKSGFARPVGYPKTQITKVGVVGAGLMGHGISLVSLLNGIEVIEYKVTDGSLSSNSRILTIQINAEVPLLVTTMESRIDAKIVLALFRLLK